MGKINVLQEWFDNGKKISSEFLPRPVIGRGVFTKVYTTLKMYFGEDYFTITERDDKSIDKQLWIIYLLSHKNSFECIAALNKIATLLDYLHTLPRHLIKEFESLRGRYNDPQKVHAENLRNFFYELYILRFLEQKQIEIQKKPEENGKPLDGLCFLNGKKFIIECTKPAIPKRIELDVIKRLATDFIPLLEKTVDLPPIIVTIDFKGRVTPAYRSYFAGYLIQLRKHLNSAPQDDLMSFMIDNEYGSLRLLPFDQKIFEQVSNEGHSIIFHSKGFNNQSFADFGINCKFPVEKHEIMKNLETVLKQKKSQHIESSDVEKIIFVDSESLPEFNIGLFHQPSMFELDDVRRLHEKLRMDCLVCITLRDYAAGNLTTAIHLLAPQRLYKEASWLVEKLNKNGDLANKTYLFL